jgi:hypothetical protein
LILDILKRCVLVLSGVKQTKSTCDRIEKSSKTDKKKNTPIHITIGKTAQLSPEIV